MLTKEEITAYARAAAWAENGFTKLVFHDDKTPATGLPDGWPKGVDEAKYTEKYEAQYIPKGPESKTNPPEPKTGEMVTNFRRQIDGE